MHKKIKKTDPSKSSQDKDRVFLLSVFRSIYRSSLDPVQTELQRKMNVDLDLDPEQERSATLSDKNVAFQNLVEIPNFIYRTLTLGSVEVHHRLSRVLDSSRF